MMTQLSLIDVFSFFLFLFSSTDYQINILQFWSSSSASYGLIDKFNYMLLLVYQSRNSKHDEL